MRWVAALACLLLYSALGLTPLVQAAGPAGCASSSTPLLTMTWNNPALAENNAADRVTYYWNISSVTGEETILSGRLVLKDPNSTTILDITKTVVASDLTRTAEPAAVNNGVVVWNPTAADNTLSFKFLRTFPKTDSAGAWTIQGSGSNASGAGNCTLRSYTLHNWVQISLNEEIGSGYYNTLGQWQSDNSWGLWATNPTSTVAATNYIRFANSGTKAGPVTITVDYLLDSKDTMPSSSLTFKVGRGPAPIETASWTTLSPAGGPVSFNVPVGGDPTWAYYNALPPAGTAAGGVTGQVTITY